MPKLIQIMDPAIGIVNTEHKNINGIPGVTYYFSRKTIDSNLPIEISFVFYDNEVHAVSKQLTGSRLREGVVLESNVYLYKNDIIFDKNEIILVLESIAPTIVEINTPSVINNLFGIDISGIVNISAFEFSKMIYIDDLDMGAPNSSFDGYMMIFHDISTKSLKMGIFAGELLPYTQREYADKINEYGKRRILSEVKITNMENKSIIVNTSKFRVAVKMRSYTFDLNRPVYSDRNHTIVFNDDIKIILDPEEEYILTHEKLQRPRVYSLYDNPIHPPLSAVFSSNSSEYLQALEYISENPFIFELAEVLVPVSAFDPDRYYMISSFHHLFLDKYNFPHAILDKSDDSAGVSIIGPHGSILIDDNDKVSSLISSGMSSLFQKNIKVFFRSKLRRIYSYLGEDQMNIVMDYTIASTRQRLLSLENRIVYNDTISTPMQSFSVTLGILGNINEVIMRGAHTEYVDSIVFDDLPCKEQRSSIVTKLLNSELMTSNYLRFNANEILNNPSKKVYSGPIYRTLNGEVDDAYDMYQKSVLSEIDGYNLVSASMTISSADFAAVMPMLNMREDEQNDCYEDFTYSVKENIQELGLEISLNEALINMQRAAYVYKQPQDIIATVTIGYTLDGEWYFCGEDFAPVSTVDNAEFTTYLDNEIVSLSRDMTDGYRGINDRQLTLDSNDWDEDYKQYLHDAFRAIVIGDISPTVALENPGLRYIVEHLVDQNNKVSYSYEEMFLHSRDAIYGNGMSGVKNTILMPNIFEQLIQDEKIGFIGYVGDDNIHYFGKRKKEYAINYSDLQIDDAYDSAYEIGHSVDLLMNTENIKLGATLFDSYGQMLFGVDLGEYNPVDKISVSKQTNIMLDGEYYAFCVTIERDNIGIFAIAYDYKTKNLKIVNYNSLKIVSYPLLLASFDILLHDYYHSIEGYKRVSLGIYDYYSSTLPEGTMSKQFLLMNNIAPEAPTNKLLSVVVDAFDASIVIDEGDTGLHSVNIGNLTDDRFYKMSAGSDGTTLHIDIDGSSPREYSMSTLREYPEDRISQDGCTLRLFRIPLYIPISHIGDSLTRVTVTIVFMGSEDESMKLMNGELVVVDFAERREMVDYYGNGYNFALGGDGLLFWKRTDDFYHSGEIIYGIEDIFSTPVTTVTVGGIEMLLEFE